MTRSFGTDPPDIRARWRVDAPRGRRTDRALPACRGLGHESRLPAAAAGAVDEVDPSVLETY
jgi:hypothetical protein